MATTLREILEAVEGFRATFSPVNKTKKESIALKYLGKFKGIIPKGKSSVQYIKELRSTLYGKVK